jgi:ribonuclease HI
VVTVATDASVRPIEGAAAWGAVIASTDGAVLRLRGRLEVADSCHAELLAVRRALGATKRGEAVALVVDNNRVVAWLRGSPPPARCARLVRTVRRMLAARRAEVRWTKAHTAGEDRLHQEADRLARGVYGASAINRGAA